MLEKIIGFYMITIRINYEEIVKIEVMFPNKLHHESTIVK